VPYRPVVAPNDNEAIAALVLGILSLFCCPVLGPIAIVLGTRSRQRIESSAGALAGSGLAIAGLVLGIVGTVFLGLGIVYVLIAILGALAVHALD
jgi:lipopolysaccharide export LptBFGC system permease protein LptF